MIVNNVPSSALSSKAANHKQIGTKCLQQSGGKEVCFFFYAWSHWFDWFKLLLWSRWSWIVTAHEESLKIPVQLYSGLILLCEIEFTRKIKNCKQTWKNLNAWRPLKEAIHAILCLLGVFTWYFSFCEIKDLSWLERHTETSQHRFCDVSLPYHILKVTLFTSQIWSSQHYFTLKSVHFIEAWKAGLGENVIRLWQWCSLVTFYSVKNSMKSAKRDLIFAKL